MKKQAPSPNKNLLRWHIKPYLVEVVISTALNVILAGLTAIVGTLVGPGFKLLSAKALSDSLLLSELFGAQIGSFLAGIFGTAEISGRTLLDWLPIVILAVAALKTAVLLAQWYISESTGEKIARDIRRRLMTAFLQVNPKSLYEQVGERAAMELSTTMTTDSRMLKDYFSRIYGGMPRELLQTIFICITLILLSKTLFIIFVLGVFPAVLLISRLGKQIRRRANRALNDYSLLSEWLQQRLLGVETIKHYGTESIEQESLRHLVNNLFLQFFRAARAKARTSPLLESVAIFAIAIVIYLSLDLINDGELSGSVVLSFLSSLALMGQSASLYGKYYSSMKEAGAAVDRIQSIFDFCNRHQRGDISIPVAYQMATTVSSLVMSEVAILYADCDQPALADFSFEFKGPIIYGICGHSGAGKSTFASAVLGLRQVDCGNIQLRLPDSIRLDTTAMAIGYMPQDVLLVPGSILQNIGYPDLDPDEGRAWLGLEAVQMVEVVRSLPQGIYTDLHASGLNLSGGQRQRILLARLWYRPYGMVLIDEGTSGLDAELEALVFLKLRQIANQGTLVIMIAHRLTALEFCDHLVLLKHGRLVASGSYSGLKQSVEFSRYLGV